jgi:hypothetical protein
MADCTLKTLPPVAYTTFEEPITITFIIIYIWLINTNICLIQHNEKYFTNSQNLAQLYTGTMKKLIYGVTLTNSRVTKNLH